MPIDYDADDGTTIEDLYGEAGETENTDDEWNFDPPDRDDDRDSAAGWGGMDLSAPWMAGA